MGLGFVMGFRLQAFDTGPFLGDLGFQAFDTGPFLGDR